MMMFALLLLFFPLVAGDPGSIPGIYRNYLPHFVVAVSYHIYEKCAGLLIAMKNVLVFDCDFLQIIDLEMENITMKINETRRNVIKIKQYNEIFEDEKMLPLYVLQANHEFFVDVSPITLNGGDLLETCEVAMIQEFILGFKKNKTLIKKIKPLPYEVCKRQIPEMKFNKRELCVLDQDDEFIFETGSPLLCNEYLTGLKLYSMPLTRKPNVTVHVYVRMTSLINWFMEDYNGDNPSWIILESDYEEKAIIGNKIRLEFSNSGNSQNSQWILSAQAILFHYLNKFINSSVFHF